MKAQTLTIRKVKADGTLPADSGARVVLLMRDSAGKHGGPPVDSMIVYHYPEFAGGMAVKGWTHYVVLPGLLRP